jgi:hypothetical protein
MPFGVKVDLRLGAEHRNGVGREASMDSGKFPAQLDDIVVDKIVDVRSASDQKRADENRITSNLRSRPLKSSGETRVAIIDKNSGQ